ncbi:MAG: hypothetical protein AB7F36_10430 [Reyranellaceae bacterium]
MAFIHDLAAPDAATPAGADAASVERARAALRGKKLLADQRVSTVETGVVEHYSRALLLGTRGAQFLPEIAAVRDAVRKRDRSGIEAAIGDLYQAAGRKRPTGESMSRLVTAVAGAVDAEGPAESVRRRFDGGGNSIEVADARRAGLFTVDVTTTDSAGQPVRTVFVGERSSRPNPSGKDLQDRVVPKSVCTVDAAQATAMRDGLNGEWSDGSGGRWTVAGEGDRIVLRNVGGDGTTLSYAGSFRLGRIEGRHAIRSAGDIGAELPLWVRSGLAGWNPVLYFVVRLDACPGDDALVGTWQSQHVTYSPSFQTISRVHDPYELRLTLRRDAPARGLAALP